jgi:hypothetical protein
MVQEAVAPAGAWGRDLKAPSESEAPDVAVRKEGPTEVMPAKS